jgi:hypothetical protein
LHSQIITKWGGISIPFKNKSLETGLNAFASFVSISSSSINTCTIFFAVAALICCKILVGIFIAASAVSVMLNSKKSFVFGFTKLRSFTTILVHLRRLATALHSNRKLV